MTVKETTRSFALGRTYITPNAEEKLESKDVAAALGRHANGDWGDLGAEDWQQNERALKWGDRLFSCYTDRLNTRFYIITEADRSVTTVLLPEDY